MSGMAFGVFRTSDIGKRLMWDNVFLYQIGKRWWMTINTGWDTPSPMSFVLMRVWSKLLLDKQSPEYFWFYVILGPWLCSRTMIEGLMSWYWTQIKAVMHNCEFKRHQIWNFSIIMFANKHFNEKLNGKVLKFIVLNKCLFFYSTPKNIVHRSHICKCWPHDCLLPKV